MTDNKQNRTSYSIFGKSLEELLLEVIIVVLGILIAFFLDNWWSGVQENRQHDSLCLSLKEEFSQNHQDVIETIEIFKNAKSCTISLLDMEESDFNISNDESIDSLLFYSLGKPRYEPNISVVLDMINSGELKLLNNEHLQKEIADWMSQLQTKDIIEKEASIRVESFTMSYLYDHISFIKLDSKYSRIKELRGRPYEKNHDFKAFKSLRFTNFLDDQIFHFHEYLSCLEMLLKQNVRILEIINEELK